MIFNKRFVSHNHLTRFFAANLQFCRKTTDADLGSAPVGIVLEGVMLLVYESVGFPFSKSVE